jgi:hypothetical protein
MNEILDSIAREYQWPNYPQTKQQEIIALRPSIIPAAVGRYVGDEDVFDVFARGDRLFGRFPGAGEVEIHATEQDRFFVPQFGSPFIRFERQGDAPASSVRMGSNGRMEFRREKCVLSAR